MTLKLYTYIQHSTDPYENLAVEEILRRHLYEGEVILYLWQNAHTVVIGKNQSAEDECNLEAMQENGIHLARRLSGGGAVFHDEGNLNFSFLACDKDYDKAKQNQVILEAVKSFGINASISGRNDLLAEDRKFSGHAYYSSKGKQCHHGTLMIGVDQSALSNYLHVSETKLKKRGVASVKSRVINLQQLNPEITVATMRDALINSFANIYGATPIPYEGINQEEVSVQRDFLANNNWLLGAKKPNYKKISASFSWGEITLHYLIENNLIKDMVIYSDALDVALLESLPSRLINQNLETLVLQGTSDEQPILNNIYDLLKSLIERRQDGITL